MSYKTIKGFFMITTMIIIVGALSLLNTACSDDCNCAENHDNDGCECELQNDISKLLGKLWVYDYIGDDHPYFNVFQFNSDLTIYECIPNGGIVYDMIFYSNGESYLTYAASSGEFYTIENFFSSIEKYNEFHEELVEGGKLNYYNESVIRTFEWGDVSYILNDDVITLSNGVELSPLVYTIPEVIEIIPNTWIFGDNPSLGISNTFIYWENNEFVLKGYAGEPNSEIEIAVNTDGKYITDTITIFAKGTADSDGYFSIVMPKMSAGFIIGTNRMYLIAKAPGKDRSRPTLYTTCFFIP